MRWQALLAVVVAAVCLPRVAADTVMIFEDADNCTITPSEVYYNVTDGVCTDGQSVWAFDFLPNCNSTDPSGAWTFATYVNNTQCGTAVSRTVMGVGGSCVTFLNTRSRLGPMTLTALLCWWRGSPPPV